MRFAKMHGIGNDFIIVDGFNNPIDAPGPLARRLCARRFGVGADGLILALPSEIADARMRIINSDGSEPEMCGNGIRCLGKYLYESGLCRKNPMTVETQAGVLTLELTLAGEQVTRVTVDMGRPRLEPEQIPVDAVTNRVAIALDGTPVRFFCVSMGNPHAVTFDLYPEEADFLRLGAYLEGHPLFPNRANIEFCRLSADGGVDVKVWERGDGPTLACGTGACAVLTAGASQGLISRQAIIHLPGGDLEIRWAEDDHLFMTGPAETVYTGELEV